MATQLPETLNIRTITNKGSIPIPPSIDDIADITDVLCSCPLFTNEICTENVAKIAAELIKRRKEGFMGRFSAFFRFSNAETKSIGVMMEVSLMVISKRKQLICEGKMPTREGISDFIIDKLSILLAPADVIWTSSILDEQLTRLIDLDLNEETLEHYIRSCVAEILGESMNTELYEEWFSFFRELAHKIVEYNYLRNPNEVDVTVYWQVYESSTELPQLFEIITLHHRETKRRWFRKKTREWNSTHHKPRGLTGTEIERVRDNLETAIDSMKQLEYERIMANKPLQSELTTTYMWCCPSEVCKHEFFRLLEENNCHICGSQQACWRCSVCERNNPIAQRFCECDAHEEVSMVQFNALITKGWLCPSCYFYGNPMNQIECGNTSCGMPRPGINPLPLLLRSHECDAPRGMELIERTNEDENHTAERREAPVTAQELYHWVCCNERHELHEDACRECGIPRMYWQCLTCEHEDNELWETACQSCGGARPHHIVTCHLLVLKN